MSKCPVISLQDRQRQKRDVGNPSSLSAMLSDGIGEIPVQGRARIYAFRKPEMQNETHALPHFDGKQHPTVTMTDMPPKER